MATLKARQKRITSRCICTPSKNYEVSSLASAVVKRCRYGYCNEWRCPVCNGFLAGAGLAGCRCDGDLRWVMHRDMAPASVRWFGNIAVKPSLPKRNKRQ